MQATFCRLDGAANERTIRKFGMFSHDERLLVAVSGGKDSLSLWDICGNWDMRWMGYILIWALMKRSHIPANPGICTPVRRTTRLEPAGN
jgi:hypothetical protein